MQSAAFGCVANEGNGLTVALAANLCTPGEDLLLPPPRPKADGRQSTNPSHSLADSRRPETGRSTDMNR